MSDYAFCPEFIETGRCDHSDAEHDALAEAVPGPVGGESGRVVLTDEERLGYGWEHLGQLVFSESSVESLLTARLAAALPAPVGEGDGDLAGLLAAHAWGAAYGGCPEPCGWQSSNGEDERDEHAAHVAERIRAAGWTKP